MTNAVYSPDGRSIAVNFYGSDRDFDVDLIDAATGAGVARIPGGSSNFTTLAFSPDGTKLVTGRGNDLILWDLSKIVAK